MLVERENEIFNILNKLKADFVVVGGYAVSGLAKHRFSVDSDLVISKAQLQSIIKILEEAGFKEHTKKGGFDKIYGGEFINFVKILNNLPVTIDLLVNSLTSRTTEATWSFEYILSNSVETKITGIEKTTTCKTPTKELLLAMKIHSGRRTDVRDIIMLIPNTDKTKVLEHTKRGNIEKLKKTITSIKKALSDKNLPDSLKGVFVLQDKVDKEIEHSKKYIEFIYENL